MGGYKEPKIALVGALSIDEAFERVAEAFGTSAEAVACGEGSGAREARLAVAYVAVRLVKLSCLKEARPSATARWVAGRAYGRAIREELGGILGCGGEGARALYWQAVDLRERDGRFRETLDGLYGGIASEHGLDAEALGVRFTA